MNGVSVVVCCYNSVARLKQTLEHLSNQATDTSIAYEVIVVDNASADGTADYAQEVWKDTGNQNTAFTVVHEARAGLSAARETGIRSAAFEYIVFCDDDNWLGSDYVVNTYKLLSSYPQVAAVGGVNSPVFEITPPEWFKFYEHSYAVGSQGQQPFEILPPGRFLFGAGIAFRKSVFVKVKHLGYNFQLSDRKGKLVAGGGDVELCYLFQLLGYDLAFSGNLSLQHFIPANRLTKSYLLSMWKLYPPSWLIFEAYKAALGLVPVSVRTSESYWLKMAVRRILRKAGFLLHYGYNKMKGNFEVVLPFETEIKYNIYLLRRRKELVKLVDLLQTKVEIE